MSYLRQKRIRRILSDIRRLRVEHAEAREDQGIAEEVKADFAANQAFDRAKAARDRIDELKRELARIGTHF